MRVLQVNTYHYRRGGDCVHALGLADALREQGHEVRFFGMHHPENLPSADEDYWLPYLDFVELNASKSPRNALRVLQRTLYSTEAARGIRRMVGDWRPDVANFHSVMGHLSLSVLVELNRLGVPVVWTLHDYKLLCPNTQLLRRGEVCEACKGGHFTNCLRDRCKKDSAAASAVAMLEAQVARFIGPGRRVTTFVAPSRFLLDKFAEFGWDTSNFVHVPNFAPGDDVPARRAVDENLFVYAGRLDPAKGVGTLIDAVGRTRDARLQVAGDGPLREELLARAERTAPGRVTFLGRVGADELSRLRDAAVATIVPSEWYENSPYSVTEAFRRGCPAIASRIGGLPELVIDEETGLLFDARDAGQLADRMRRLSGDPALRARLSEGARAAAERLGIEDYAFRMVEVYRAAQLEHKGVVPA